MINVQCTALFSSSGVNIVLKMDDLLVSTYEKDSNLGSGGEEEDRSFDIHDQ